MDTVAEFKAKKDVPVITADNHGIITYINSRFNDVYGWSEADLVGKPLSTIIPPSLHDAHNLGFSRFMLTGKPTLLGKTLSLKVITHDGVEMDAQHCIIAEQINGDWVFAATISPGNP
jgi:PAS domain S-box-containing protein